MYKTLAAVGVAAALLFAAPQGASALPGQGTDTKNYKHRHWRRGHGHNHHRFAIHLPLVSHQACGCISG